MHTVLIFLVVYPDPPPNVEGESGYETSHSPVLVQDDPLTWWSERSSLTFPGTSAAPARCGTAASDSGAWLVPCGEGRESWRLHHSLSFWLNHISHTLL